MHKRFSSSGQRRQMHEVHGKDFIRTDSNARLVTWLSVGLVPSLSICLHLYLYLPSLACLYLPSLAFLYLPFLVCLYLP